MPGDNSGLKRLTVSGLHRQERKWAKDDEFRRGYVTERVGSGENLRTVQELSAGTAGVSRETIGLIS